MNGDNKCTSCQMPMGSQHVNCSLCRNSYHVRCLNTSARKWEVEPNWFCETCGTVFPFYSLDDDDFKTFLTDDLNWSFENESLFFNPFDLDRDYDTHGLELDPDINFFSNAKNCNSCDYYDEVKFSKLLQSFSNLNQTFSVLHLNVRSLPKNHERMLHFISSLNYEFSVIALTETWLTEQSKELGLYELHSYNSTHFVRQSRSGGGVSIFVHKDLDFIIRHDLAVKLNETEIESVFIEILSDSRTKNLIIGSIYRPPNTDIVNFNQCFSSTLELINRENKICSILGDFNINLFNKETHSATDDFLNYLNENFFSPQLPNQQESQNVLPP